MFLIYLEDTSAWLKEGSLVKLFCLLDVQPA